jgi:hypothetical protein
MPIYVPGKVVLAKGYPNDPDVLAYIAAVQAADESASPGIGALEIGTVKAIDDFVTGCKSDGIWLAIKASCILAGARTLAGALVPLVGTAPTNVGGLFVAGDYNRKTGLEGDGSTKSLNSNRNNNADPQNSKHIAVRVSTISTTGATSYMGQAITSGATHLTVEPSNVNTLSVRLNSAIGIGALGTNIAGFIGVSRSSSTVITLRSNNTNTPIITGVDSATPATGNLLIFDGVNKSNARLAFYSIGESLNLALLDTRVTALINAFAAAIP